MAFRGFMNNMSFQNLQKLKFSIKSTVVYDRLGVRNLGRSARRLAQIETQCAHETELFFFF